MKLWGGRFSKQTAKEVDDFNSSIRFDARLYREDIQGSIAHARMLGDTGVIDKAEAEKIIEGLRAILQEIENGEVEFSVDAEDIHMNIETLLIQKIGDTGKRLHTGRSRNDQVALDLRLYLRREILEIQPMLKDLLQTLLELAEKQRETIMPGYTHLQKAQPITLAHHLMAYFEMFKRDTLRLTDCMARGNESPLGSGALAGTTYPLNRMQTAQELGFTGPTLNSLDGVSDRDYALEFLFCCSMIAMHLSRFSEEIILWNTNEFSFIELDDAYSTGSSIMPQKKNPDVAELVRGKTGRVYGDLITLLTVMKGIPLAYNKDMQEDKEAVFDAADTIKMCVPVFTQMLATMTVKEENMRAGAAKGFTNATDAADYLVKKGMPFRDAHKVIGEMVAYAIEHDKALDEFTMDEFKQFSDIIQNDIYEEISLLTCVKNRNLTGGPSPEAEKNAIRAGRDWLKAQQ